MVGYSPRGCKDPDTTEHLSTVCSSLYWKLLTYRFAVKVKLKVTQSCPTLCDPMDCIVYEILQARIVSPRDLPNSGIKPRSSALQVDSLPTELPGKPKNTGVGNISLLQWIYLTHELNWGLLHCRWILYQLSYQGEINFGYNSHFYLFILVQSFIKFRGNNSLTLLNISRRCFYLEFLLGRRIKSGWAGPIFFFLINICFIAI